MAGEWLVGGVEAKGFAYVFVLLGLERWCARWGAAVLLFGAASAFHVVSAVGPSWRRASFGSPARTARRLRRLILPLAGGLLLALPGLWPALALTARRRSRKS